MSHRDGRAWWLLGCLSWLSCSAVPPHPECASNADCSATSVCTAGQCVSTPLACAEGSTRPCGPQPIGPCRTGTQRCVSGLFETTCTGAINPSAEVCNGLDDDCDGTIDDGVTLTFYVDADRDGFGSNVAGALTNQGCVRPTGFSDNHRDCDDRPGVGRFINPNAAEVCEPGLVDENCNGMTNEGCSCTAVDGGCTGP